MRIQEGSSSNHIELAAKNTPVTITPGKGFQTESLLSSAAPKGCIATLVDWVKSLFQKIWNLLTCQFSSSKTKESTEVDEEASSVEEQIQEKLGEWLAPYYPDIEKFWDKMNFEEREGFFWQIAYNGLPAVTTKEIIDRIEWIKIAHPIYAKNKEKLSTYLKILKSETSSSSNNINTLLGALIEKKRGNPNLSEIYIEQNRKTLDRLFKENENLGSNFFSKWYAKAPGSFIAKEYKNPKFMVGQPPIFTDPIVIVQDGKAFRFSGEVQSLAASVAIAHTSMEGTLCTPYGILLELATKMPIDEKKIVINVNLDFDTYDLIFQIARISNTFFLISTEPKLDFEPWGDEDIGRICLVGIKKDSLHVEGEKLPITDEPDQFYFLPLMKVD